MSQRITITNIQEKKSKDGLKTFWIITDENKTDWSTFDAEMSQLPIGSMVDLEPKIVGKYNNIENYKLISKPAEPVEPTTPEPKQYGKPLEALQLELDAKARNTALMQACQIVCAIIQKFDKMDIDELALANRYYHWLKTGKYTEVNPGAVKNTTIPIHNPFEPEVQFANIGELFTKCWVELKIERLKVLELMQMKSDKELTPDKFLVAWQKVVEYSQRKGA